ncbi:hypothetical protein KP509_05G027300 [Ceratopteris richardii]|uniref:endo-polygalacturonase n=1 Tax=Ceratopteris richardii TaxID=49495 RepID=A0A8T2UWZ3_CERRI|nr:hypothetical protein KP509_05G027300 [Ceratopteris richardii]
MFFHSAHPAGRGTEDLRLSFSLTQRAARGDILTCQTDPGLCSVVDDSCMAKGRWSEYNVTNVDWYGAMGDGVTDDTQAFADAWNDACNSDSAVFLIPESGIYRVGPLVFKGPCAGGGLTIEIAGTLIAPSEPYKTNRSNSNAWLHFIRLSNLTVEGGGTIDGQGAEWWARSCKKNKTNECQDAPTAMKFSWINNLKLRDLQSLNSPQIHINFAHCYGVEAFNIQVRAPADSPNTDGIHIAGTQKVLIQDSWIGTGDDCISIVSGSLDVRIKSVTCGPGHGISVGSLGKDSEEEQVSLVVVDGATLIGTTNGLRIKTWQNGAGLAMGFLYENVQMFNVSNPIIIDQSYCDPPSACPSGNETSAVQVSQIFYRNIWGTSATKQAIKLACSKVAPCKNLYFEDINLVPATGAGSSTSVCQSAQGVTAGVVVPDVECLETPVWRSRRCSKMQSI